MSHRVLDVASLTRPAQKELEFEVAIRRRNVTWWIAIASTLIVGLPAVFVSVYFFSSGGTGSIDEALRLKAVVEQIPDPESGEGCDDGYAAKRFANGEWVLGIGRDSHAMMSEFRGGGTVVVKDSRGRIRCFFGHVCGRLSFMNDGPTLDDFYTGVVAGGILTEIQCP